MTRDDIVDLIKSAAEVNLRYSGIALGLVREYIKEFNGVLRDRPVTEEVWASTDGQLLRRAPILLVGRAGTQASGAFMLNNTGEAELAVNLVAQGEFDPRGTEFDPAHFTLAPQASAVVQLRVAITAEMEVDRDYTGVVVAPSLAVQPIEYVVRRLPDTPAATPIH